MLVDCTVERKLEKNNLFNNKKKEEITIKQKHIYNSFTEDLYYFIKCINIVAQIIFSKFKVSCKKIL